MAGDTDDLPDLTGVQLASYSTILLAGCLTGCNPGCFVFVYWHIEWKFGWSAANIPGLAQAVTGAIGAYLFLLVVAAVLIALRRRSERVRQCAIYAALVGYLCLTIGLLVAVLVALALGPPL